MGGGAVAGRVRWRCARNDEAEVTNKSMAPIMLIPKYLFLIILSLYVSCSF
jgi:hypothetical protein